MAVPRKWKKKVANGVLAILCEAHPKAFFPKDSTSTVPLKIGILPDLVAAHPDIPKYRLAIFLSEYTDKNRYHRAVIDCFFRVGINGEDAGDIIAEHREYSKNVMEKRAQQKAERIDAIASIKARNATPQSSIT